MTRETKIGLLIGLAFMIVIGIFLSDYKTNATEPVQAPLQTAGNTVRSGVGSPTDDGVSPVAVVPPEVTPNEPVPTRDELTPRPAVAVAENRLAPATEVPTALAEAADRGGEPIVAVGNNPAVPLVDAAAHMAVRTYTAQEGDSLSKIAMKTMGTKSKAARAAIVALNPSLKANPNKIIIGRTYNVPATAATPAAEAPVASAQPQYTYTVKPGDSLWSIAVGELGNASAVPAIKAINKDVLRGSDQVRVDMKLRLPAKPLASAN